VETSHWERFTHPGFKVEVRYPAVTPQGHEVERAEERIERHPVVGDYERVHLTSRGSEELYVEVARFAERTPEEEYELHRPYLTQRFGTGSVSELTNTKLGQVPAGAYGFRWDEGERSVLLLHVARDTYRATYDPRSALNARVIATLTVTD
jgi:hypothetical protein